MKPDLLDSVEINPPTAPRACIIWLHGLGADGHDFAPLIPELGLVNEHALRVVLPHAPYRPVTINGGQVMRAWYDILGSDLHQAEDSQGIRQSEQLIRVLIEREIASGIAAEQIVLAGFSQGGAIALQAGLRYPQRLAGILALSCYIPLAVTLAAERTAANAAVPIMMAHGLHDPVVPLALAERSRDQLLGLGYAVDWHSYPMPHAVCPAEIADLRAWLGARLPQAD
jgi:phospholipase/carboxylesterase